MTFVDESAVNLRDLNRLLKLYRRFLEETDGDQDLSLAHCIDICYLQKLYNVKSREKIIDTVIVNSGLFSDTEKVRTALSARTLVRTNSINQVKFCNYKPTIIGNGNLDISKGDMSLQDLLKL